LIFLFLGCESYHNGLVSQKNFSFKKARVNCDVWKRLGSVKASKPLILFYSLNYFIFNIQFLFYTLILFLWFILLLFLLVSFSFHKTTFVISFKICSCNFLNYCSSFMLFITIYFLFVFYVPLINYIYLRKSNNERKPKAKRIRIKMKKVILLQFITSWLNWTI